MAAKNDITGDSIISKVNSKAYEENIDKIFGEERQKRLEKKKKEDAEYWAKVQAETKERLNG